MIVKGNVGKRHPFLIVDKTGDVVDHANDIRRAKLSCVQTGDVIYKKLK